MILSFIQIGFVIILFFHAFDFIKKALETLLKRKLINEDTIKEIEKKSKSTLNFTKNDNKKISIKDKSKPKGKQQQLNYLQKNLKTFFNSS